MHDYLNAIVKEPQLQINNTCSLHKNVEPNRKLDYIFTNLTIESGTTIQDSKEEGVNPLLLSDHVPIITRLTLK